MTQSEPTFVGVTDRADLCNALRAAAHRDETLDDDRRQTMLRLADELFKGEQIASRTWIFDYMADVDLTGETYPKLRERVVVEPDGRVLLTSRSTPS